MAAVPLGQARLREMLQLAVPPPFVRSSGGPGARRTIEESTVRQEHYPPRYVPDGIPLEQFKFALKYEPLDMGVIAAAMNSLDIEPLSQWVTSEPTGAHARRAWFLYEYFTGRKLQIPDATAGAYAGALDPKLNVVRTGTNSRRHRIVDNLLGTPGFCLTIRQTAKLQNAHGKHLDEVAKNYTSHISPEVLTRAIQYLYTKETRSSFEIEHEQPTPEKSARFIQVLEKGKQFDPTDIRGLVELQNAIVDPRYAAHDLRNFQNFVGETLGGYREKVHFICPKPEDVRDLIENWSNLTLKLKGSVDPVVAAAIIAFTFVFIHPFEDGNGRIHRFLIHHVLSSQGYTPEDIVFPVSAAILRDMKSYNQVLESFSKPLFDYIDWEMTPQHEVQVSNKTDHLYRYFDATLLAEYLYEKLEETIRTDLKEEVEFIAHFDRAYQAVQNIVDMPNRRASLFVQLVMQNEFKISTAKRTQFPELSDEEIEKLETAIQDAIKPQ